MTKNESVRGSKGNVGNILNDCPDQSILCNCAANVLYHRERTMDDYSKQKRKRKEKQQTFSHKGLTQQHLYVQTLLSTA